MQVDTAFPSNKSPVLVDENIKQIPAAPFQLRPTNKKLFLFLDLDETLIHSFTTPRLDFESMEERKEHFDELARQLTIENGIPPTKEELESYPSEMMFNIRPATEEFLTKLSQYYELNIFTAGEQDYAD